MKFKRLPLHQVLFLLLLILLPTQLGYHFWPNWSFVFGIRSDYLAPTIYFTDILFFFVLIFWYLDKTKNLKLAFFNKHKIFIFFSLIFFLPLGKYLCLDGLRFLKWCCFPFMFLGIGMS